MKKLIFALVAVFAFSVVSFADDTNTAAPAQGQTMEQKADTNAAPAAKTEKKMKKHTKMHKHGKKMEKKTETKTEGAAQ